jgi:hypothetical protein
LEERKRNDLQFVSDDAYAIETLLNHYLTTDDSGSLVNAEVYRSDLFDERGVKIKQTATPWAPLIDKFSHVFS